MSTPVPLTVRVSTIDPNDSYIKDSRLITDQIRDLTFRWTDPGGFASCTVSLAKPLTGQPNEINYFGTLTVTDARNGYVVWEGRLEDPARKADTSQGQIWELTAIGGQAFLRDKVIPRMYIDTTFAGFERVPTLAPSATDSIGIDPGGSGWDAMVLQFPSGMSATTNLQAVMAYDLPDSNNVAMLRYSWDAGVTDAGYKVEWLATNATLFTVAASHTLSTGGGSNVQVWEGTHWPIGRNRLELKLVRGGANTTVANDNVWVSIIDLTVVAQRTGRDGIPITNGALYNWWVYPHEVIEDLLGGFPDHIIDSARANVSTGSTTAISQLMYVDGADEEAVLHDLMSLDGGYTYRVWDRDTTTGGYVFEWVPIPRSVRYEADVIDGYESNSTGEGIYNAVTVKWRDAKGKSQTTTVSNFDEPLLFPLGIDRISQIELGDEIGSSSAALRAGEQWLADRATPANAGRLRIARPIFDFDWGRMVQPWEIRPGLIRVRGVLPRPDALNATRRDGVTIFHIVACEYSAADGAATLELDSYPPSMPQLVGQLREGARPGGKRRDYLNRRMARAPQSRRR